MNKIKYLINSFLKKFGYQVIKAVKEEKKKEYAILNFTLDDIFNFFPHWVSKFEINNKYFGGQHDYTTKRISMLNEEDLYRLVDFKGKTIIEFGPLEGGNSIILEKLEVKRVTVIEGHIENFVRCCVIKNLCELNRTTFYFDDVMNATVEKYGKYDMGFVAGILYHLNNPHIFLNQLSKMTDEIIVSTHYADEKSPSSNADIKEICYKDFKYRGKLYKEAGGPNSGLQTFSFWPFREDLYNMLNDTGYRSINVINDLTDQGTNYKLIYLVAKKYD